MNTVIVVACHGFVLFCMWNTWWWWWRCVCVRFCVFINLGLRIEKNKEKKPKQRSTINAFNCKKQMLTYLYNITHKFISYACIESEWEAKKSISHHLIWSIFIDINLQSGSYLHTNEQLFGTKICRIIQNWTESFDEFTNSDSKKKKKMKMKTKERRSPPGSIWNIYQFCIALLHGIVYIVRATLEAQCEKLENKDANIKMYFIFRCFNMCRVFVFLLHFYYCYFAMIVDQQQKKNSLTSAFRMNFCS